MRKWWLMGAVMLLVPVVRADDSGKLEAMINKAVAGKQTVVNLPRTVYRLDRELVLDGVKNITIDGNGSTLLFTKPQAGVSVIHCDNMEMTNLTLDYDPLPFTQGTVTAISPGQAQMTVKLHAGYPLPPRLERINLHVFDAGTRSWKDGVPDYFGVKLRAGSGQGEYSVKMPSGFEKYVAVGDLAAMDWRSNSGIEIKDSKDFRMRDVTICAAPGIAILGRFNTGKHYFSRVTIKRGPMTAGMTEPRLLAVAADGLNYAYCENGPDVTDCDFSYLGDDSINFHSVAFPIIKVESPTSILVMRPYSFSEGFPLVIRQGMELRILDGRDFKVITRGKIVGCEAAKEVSVSAQTVAEFFVQHPGKERSGSVYRLKLSTPLDCKRGQFVDIPAICGANFVIRNNYFHDHRARSIRMMASNGVIENNRIERIKQNAITIGGEYAFWREAGWVENLVVRNNIIKDVGLDGRIISPQSYAPGAISLIMRAEEGVDQVTSGNRNIVIEGNRIEGCSSAGIVLHAVDGAVVKNNTLRNVGYGKIDTAGKNYGFKLTGPLAVTPSAVNVKLENNVVEK